MREVRSELDIEESIQNTLDEGGIPMMAWRKNERASHYLFLIEQQSYQDHLAMYFEELVRELPINIFAPVQVAVIVSAYSAPLFLYDTCDET